MRSGRLRFGLGLCIGVLAAALLAPTAGATLVYTTSWWSEDSALWAAHNDGSAPHRVFASNFPTVLSGPSHVSPNGRLVVYGTFEMEGQGASRLLVVPAKGGRSRTLSNEAAFLAWSPDSRTIVALLYLPSGLQRLLAIDVRSGAPTTLVDAPDVDGASVSPSGDTLVYASGAGLSAHLYTVPIGGGTPTRISDGHRSQWPLWGSRWIAFVRWEQLNRRPQLYLLNPSTGALRQLTSTFERGIMPLGWSADGRRLLVELTRLTVPHAATVDVRGGTPRTIGKPSRTNGDHGVRGIAISRDGTTILGTMSTGHPFGGIDTVTLPFRGGTPHVLARHAASPSWSR